MLLDDFSKRPVQLPEPSLLEKLKARHPDEIEGIFERAEVIARSWRAQESANVSEAYRLSPRRLISIFRDAFTGHHRTLPTLTPEREALWGDWARTGDALRAAIVEFMDVRGLTADSLNLDHQERQSLERIFPDWGRPSNKKASSPLNSGITP